MAVTKITDLLHAPVELLLEIIQERQPRLNSIFNSPLVMSAGVNYAQRAFEDGAIQVQIPILSPVSGGYTGQNPGTPPTPDKITSERQTAAIVYREKAWGRDAFAAAQSGIDPLAFIVDRVLNVRLDGMEEMLIASQNGMFASTAFASLILTTGVNEAPVASPGSNVFFDADAFHDLTGILGIKEDDLMGGIITMHSKVRTKLKKLDEIDFVPGSKSNGIPFDTYKGLRVVVDDRLIRAGTSDGYVYPVTINAPQSVILQFAPQSEDGTTSSSLAFDSDVPNLIKALYDRIVATCHINGTVWSPTDADVPPTIAACGPLDVDLALANAWATAYTDVKNTRIVRGEFNA
jgi:hypothetical protein